MLWLFVLWLTASYAEEPCEPVEFFPPDGAVDVPANLSRVFVRQGARSPMHDECTPSRATMESVAGVPVLGVASADGFTPYSPLTVGESYVVSVLDSYGEMSSTTFVVGPPLDSPAPAPPEILETRFFEPERGMVGVEVDVAASATDRWQVVMIARGGERDWAVLRVGADEPITMLGRSADVVDPGTNLCLHPVLHMPYTSSEGGSPTVGGERSCSRAPGCHSVAVGPGGGAVGLGLVLLALTRRRRLGKTIGRRSRPIGPPSRTR